jgi:hypothetical protein
MGKTEKTTALTGLQEQIAVLESRRALEEIELRNQFKQVHEVMKPANLIKSAIKDLASSSELKGNIVDSVMGMTAGFLSKKAAIGSTSNPIKIVLGNVLESVVAAGVTKNSDTIKSTIMSVIHKFITKDQTTTHEENTTTDERN